MKDADQWDHGWDDMFYGKTLKDYVKDHSARKKEIKNLNRRPSIQGPTDEERKKYPALDIAWKNLTEEYKLLYNVTIGKEHEIED